MKTCKNVKMNVNIQKCKKSLNSYKKVAECSPGVTFSSKHIQKCKKNIKFIQQSTQERGVQTGANALSALAKGRLAYPSANTGVMPV